ncbi:hypothetical protein ALNOE001_19780 [Candidatus Methanobinarius endosymbioticus]|uniref:Right handed beta helix domain-containing protein n=1 Tax=Candidatus Methanobinarius endosymbioticus TaxID=2006182 RepID=A0A366M9I4_9EURY|nr:hypothetical protein ALNOE001_19780 [Candidatus Methanobinarius endosymbioticus]
MIIGENISNIHIKNCKFVNATHAIGINGWNGEDSGKNIIISNNLFENCENGIRIEEINNLDINFNNFKNGSYGNSIQLNYCNNSKIVNNNSTNNRGNGILSSFV